MIVHRLGRSFKHCYFYIYTYLEPLVCMPISGNEPIEALPCVRVAEVSGVIHALIHPAHSMPASRTSPAWEA